MGVYLKMHSPYRLRANALKRKRRQAAELATPIFRYNSPIRTHGESEIRIPVTYGARVKQVKFHYNIGKHYKIAGGSMRRKAARRQQYTNYNNAESIDRNLNRIFNEILDLSIDRGVDRDYCAFTDPKFGKHSPATINYLNKQAQHLESDTSPLGKELHKSTTRVLEKLSKNEQK